MTGRSWEPTKKGAKDLERWLSKGKTVYTVLDVAQPVVRRYEDAQLCSAHTFTRRSPITGHWMTGHLSAAGLLAQEGTVYEHPPAGMRNVATPGPQVAAPTSQQALDRLREEDALLDDLAQAVAKGRAKTGSRR